MSFVLSATVSWLPELRGNVATGGGKKKLSSDVLWNYGDPFWGVSSDVEEDYFFSLSHRNKGGYCCLMGRCKMGSKE